MNRDRAFWEPDIYCSMIIDGAGQSAVVLPDSISKRKAEQDRLIKFKLAILFEYSKRNMLNQYTTIEYNETGSSHIVEVFHRFVYQYFTRSSLL